MEGLCESCHEPSHPLKWINSDVKPDDDDDDDDIIYLRKSEEKLNKAAQSFNDRLLQVRTGNISLNFPQPDLALVTAGQCNHHLHQLCHLDSKRNLLLR